MIQQEENYDSEYLQPILFKLLICYSSLADSAINLICWSD